VIHLDTNYLIQGARNGTAENVAIEKWVSSREPLGTSALAWMEFITGPLAAEAETHARVLLENRIVPFGTMEAELAARLFNVAGRRRGLRYDCMIAAAAITAGAELATTNTPDFLLFLPHGLKLAATARV
jgi:predicted nucleic acid-binding protein